MLLETLPSATFCSMTLQVSPEMNACLVIESLQCEGGHEKESALVSLKNSRFSRVFILGNDGIRDEGRRDRN